MPSDSQPEKEARSGSLDLDGDVRALCAQGSYEQAATLALRRLGDELLRFLVHSHRDETEAADVFSLAAEDIWRGLAKFRWESSLRTWSYCLVRRASARYRRQNQRSKRIEVVALDDLGGFSEIVAQVKSQTLSAMRTERRTKLEQLRDELSVDERMLLALRIDRELTWKQIALVLGREHEREADVTDEDPDDTAAVARLRKRFQLLKDRLKRRGRELGLIAANG